MTFLSRAACFALLLAPAAGAMAPPIVDSAGEARPTIEKANADWERCMVSGDADCIVAPYAKDAVFVQDDGKTVIGKKAIRALYVQSGDGETTIESANITTDAIVGVGSDLVYEYGYGFIETLNRAEKKRESLSSPYMTVWQKGADGQWRIIRNLVF